MIIEIVRNRVLFILLSIVLTSSCSKEQTKKTFINNCFDEEKTDLINKMVSSFEHDICKYYEYSEKEVDKAIIKYLTELKKAHKNLVVLDIASKRSKTLLKKSFEILSNDVWITYQEEHSPSKRDSVYSQHTIDEVDTVSSKEIDDDLKIDIPVLDKEEVLEDRLKKDSINRVDMMRKYKNKHYLRIYSKLVNCIYKKTKNKSAKELYETTLKSGRISPFVFIGGLINLAPKDLHSDEIKVFIALELFYSPLDFELK